MTKAKSVWRGDKRPDDPFTRHQRYRRRYSGTESNQHQQQLGHASGGGNENKTVTKRMTIAATTSVEPLAVKKGNRRSASQFLSWPSLSSRNGVVAEPLPTNKEEAGKRNTQPQEQQQRRRSMPLTATANPHPERDEPQRASNNSNNQKSGSSLNSSSYSRIRQNQRTGGFVGADYYYDTTKNSQPAGSYYYNSSSCRNEEDYDDEDGSTTVGAGNNNNNPLVVPLSAENYASSSVERPSRKRRHRGVKPSPPTIDNTNNNKSHAGTPSWFPRIRSLGQQKQNQCHSSLTSNPPCDPQATKHLQQQQVDFKLPAQQSQRHLRSVHINNSDSMSYSSGPQPDMDTPVHSLSLPYRPKATSSSTSSSSFHPTTNNNAVITVKDRSNQTFALVVPVSSSQKHDARNNNNNHTRKKNPAAPRFILPDEMPPGCSTTSTAIATTTSHNNTYNYNNNSMMPSNTRNRDSHMMRHTAKNRTSTTQTYNNNNTSGSSSSTFVDYMSSGAVVHHIANIQTTTNKKEKNRCDSFSSSDYMPQGYEMTLASQQHRPAQSLLNIVPTIEPTRRRSNPVDLDDSNPDEDGIQDEEEDAPGKRDSLVTSWIRKLHFADEAVFDETCCAGPLCLTEDGLKQHQRMTNGDDSSLVANATASSPSKSCYAVDVRSPSTTVKNNVAVEHSKSLRAAVDKILYKRKSDVFDDRAGKQQDADHDDDDGVTEFSLAPLNAVEDLDKVTTAAKTSPSRMLSSSRLANSSSAHIKSGVVKTRKWGFPKIRRDKTSVTAVALLERERLAAMESETKRLFLENQELVRIDEKRQKYLDMQRARERDQPQSLSAEQRNSVFVSMEMMELEDTSINDKQKAFANDNASTQHTIPTTTTESSSAKPTTVTLPACVVCHEKSRTHIATPCMHFAYCAKCSRRLSQSGRGCVICMRKDVLFAAVSV